jgi:E3 ubiquitin-protein ligase listerin
MPYGQELTSAVGRLPDELVSLLLNAPSLEKYPDEALAQFPTSIRGYLLSWHLVFDAYGTAGAKVGGDYTEHLKTEACVGPLLDFMFDVLGHSAAHPLNLDKAGFTTEHIKKYDVKVADSEPDERNMQWLLLHLCFLTLKYANPLFKQWYLDCRVKQTKIAVEAWVARYYSPIIIAETLDEVEAWAKSQEPPGEDEKELEVKVSRATKDITAAYEVDESHISIGIHIPPAFPLEGVSVVGGNRMVVNEKKWQSWLMTTQGIITFSVGPKIRPGHYRQSRVVGNTNKTRTDLSRTGCRRSGATLLPF